MLYHVTAKIKKIDEKGNQEKEHWNQYIVVVAARCSLYFYIISLESPKTIYPLELLGNVAVYM